MHKLTKIEELNLDMYWDFIETFKLSYDPNNQSTYKVGAVLLVKIYFIKKKYYIFIVKISIKI